MTEPTTAAGPWKYLYDDYSAGTVFITCDPQGSQTPLVVGLTIEQAAPIVAALNDARPLVWAEYESALAEVRAVLAALPPSALDAGRLDRNHYDRFTAREVTDLLSDEGLAETHRKFTEALTDPFVHDAAKIVVALVDEIQRGRALPPSAPPELDVERLLTVLRARKHTFTTSLTMHGDEVAAEYARPESER